MALKKDATEKGQFLSGRQEMAVGPLITVTAMGIQPVSIPYLSVVLLKLSQYRGIRRHAVVR